MDKATAADFYADPNNSIGYLSRIAFRSFSRALEKRTLPHGVTAGQWRFLRVLWREDGLTQRELSRRVGMREPTTVTALKSLEKSGFVRRKQSEDDRRKIHVFLTPAAKKLQAVLAPCVAEVNEIALKGLSAEEVATLRRLLQHVGRNLAPEVDAPPSDASA
ncbi:MarR family transcriptional regulator [Phenylobacterium sp.]|uniref:MarR family winged helix-turn-helix transcriptional regulator n=1 Tax=Phenylobacterium sp. TaxID=1871053 RepID=UPI002CD8D638|nr:MarR family transcriptional regulator [Phenylobacterium sp.]HVI33890.1 MarR family transcriptional regulator [Phenylobacterium sp.]